MVGLNNFLNQHKLNPAIPRIFSKVSKKYGETFFGAIYCFESAEVNAVLSFLEVVFRGKDDDPYYHTRINAPIFLGVLWERLSVLPPVVMVGGKVMKMTGFEPQIHAVKINYMKGMSDQDIYQRIGGEGLWLIWNVNATLDKVHFVYPDGRKEGSYLSTRDVAVTSIPFFYVCSDNDDRYQLFIKIACVARREDE